MRLPPRSAVARLIALAALAGCASVPAETRQPPLATLVDAERAFAAAAVAEGSREAFLRYAADDALIFTPAPTNVGDYWRPRPSRRGTVLHWVPSVARISLSGDLGFTTGPYETRSASGGEPTGHGWYVTVWRNEGPGWRFVADIGTPNPAPRTPPAPWTAPRSIPSADPRRAPTDDESLATLRAADQAFARIAAERGFAIALFESAAEDVRLHRPGAAPFVGEEEVAVLTDTISRRYSAEPGEAHVARHGDLGYTVGEYRLADESGNGRHESGWYLRLWTREGGAWRILLDAVSPLPPEREE